MHWWLEHCGPFLDKAQLEKCGVPPRVLELEDSTLMLVETQLHPERLLIAQYVKYTTDAS